MNILKRPCKHCGIVHDNLMYTDCYKDDGMASLDEIQRYYEKVFKGELLL
jgi:hypothetical protein